MKRVSDTGKASEELTPQYFLCNRQYFFSPTVRSNITCGQRMLKQHPLSSSGLEVVVEKHSGLLMSTFAKSACWILKHSRRQGRAVSCRMWSTAMFVSTWLVSLPRCRVQLYVSCLWTSTDRNAHTDKDTEQEPSLKLPLLPQWLSYPVCQTPWHVNET